MKFKNGYFLTSSERDLNKANRRPFSEYEAQSIAFNYFLENCLKIGALSAIYDHVEEINFNENQKELFTEGAAIFYTDDRMKIQEMKKYSKTVLTNQMIVGVAANWESYFSSIIQTIFNDSQYLKYSTTIERIPQFKKMLRDLNVNAIFENECSNNNQLINNFQLGTIIVNSKKIRFSQPNQIGKIMNCFGIDLIKHAKLVEPNFWEVLNRLVDARHVIVHEQKDVIGRKNKKGFDENVKIAEVYTPEIIMENLWTMHKIINHIDVILFSQYCLDN